MTDSQEPNPPAAPGQSAEQEPLIPERTLLKLRALRDYERMYISGPLPADHPLFPGQSVEITNYYMNRADPPELGLWKIEVPGTMKVRLTTVGTERGLKYIISVPSADKPGEYVKAGVEAEPKVAAALEIFDANITDGVMETWTKPEPKPRKPLLRFLGFKREKDGP